MLLGNVPFTVANLLSATTAGFPFRAPQSDQTMFVRRALQALGESLSYRVICEGPGRHFDAHEPSLDLTWWEPGTGTILAADCEWGVAGDVAAAFERLMAVKAPMKLLIFGSRRAGNERQDILLRTDIEAVLKAIGAAILDFGQHLEGELYVLLERLEQEPLFRSYEFRVPADGKLKLQFEQAAQVFRAREACAAI